MKYDVICSSFDSLDLLHRKVLTENYQICDNSLENLKVEKLRGMYGN